LPMRSGRATSTKNIWTGCARTNGRGTDHVHPQAARDTLKSRCFRCIYWKCVRNPARGTGCARSNPS
jgi:hypothetical protein